MEAGAFLALGVLLKDMEPEKGEPRRFHKKTMAAEGKCWAWN